MRAEYLSQNDTLICKTAFPVHRGRSERTDLRRSLHAPREVSRARVWLGTLPSVSPVIRKMAFPGRRGRPGSADLRSFLLARSKPTAHRAIVAFALFAFAAILNHPVVAAQWNAGDRNWEETAKWGGALPPINAVARIDGRSHVTLDRGSPALSRLDLGTTGATPAATASSAGSTT